MTHLLLVAAVALVAVLACAGAVAGAEWHVYPGAGTPIQTTIDGAGAGDTIYVHAGEYVENVDVDKRVTLVGDGADVVAVRAADAEGHVFNVTTDWVNVSGFAVAGAGYSKAGIRLSNGVDHCNIYNNNASSNGCGICLSDSSSNTLESNTASYNYNGIYLYSSSDNMLANNTVSSNNYDGIYLYSSSKYNTLANNTVSSNNWRGIVLSYSSGNTLVSNTANSNDEWGIILYDSSGNTLANNTASSNNYDGTRLYGSSGNTLTDNTANSNNGNGIYLTYSSNNMLANNIASNNGYGIRLYGSSNNMLASNAANLNNICGIVLSSSSDNMLANNTASSNNWGICLSDSSNNTLANNIASNNGYGIGLYGSSNNTLTINNLIDNEWHNAYDTGTNHWDDGSAGNYYSDYNGTDPDGDGIGEGPHLIPGGESEDRYPLMQPWTDTPQKGDLNADGILTPADAAIALRLAATGAQNPAADVSGDDRVTSLDALMILQAAARRIEL